MIANVVAVTTGDVASLASVRLVGVYTVNHCFGGKDC
jgi:hypothetical protein